ncbi:hypothetical protein [Kutzneria kofuensis]|uniref:hypothetical protein n=1 Tax=Kutzneria kofuensis TaxID=103725 RepID=UPI0031EE5E76
MDLDDEPALHPHRLLLDGWFDVRELTGEDLKRPAKYRDELVRKDFMHGFDSIADYLAELGVRVRLARVEPADVPRVSQLTLRTNQFNLTTKTAAAGRGAEPAGRSVGTGARDPLR